jgi:hypothetical protein
VTYRATDARVRAACCQRHLGMAMVAPGPSLQCRTLALNCGCLLLSCAIILPDIRPLSSLRPDTSYKRPPVLQNRVL